MKLESWGWDDARGKEAAAVAPPELRICRVVGQGRDLCALTDGESTRLAAVSGAFRYKAVLPSEYPVTGDFVACREEQGDLVIEWVLPRKGVLSRKAAGKRNEEQVLAANVDTVLLVFALDGGRGFLPRLVERFLTLTRESGAEPLIVLNKADLAECTEPYREEAERSAPGVDVISVSAKTGSGLELLAARLEPRRTFFLLGKSGVGKSSLINAMFGADIVRTSEIRENDGRGRHTTTSRDLFMLPNGSLLLDSPGLREAALWADESAVDGAFPDISSLARGCRFRDCRHMGEPGCAVVNALVEGSLDNRRYESYLEYRKEARYHQLMSEGNAERCERTRWKNISKMQKRFKRREDRF